MDSFLVEAKNQYGEERSLEQLNQDRNLFMDNVMELFATQKKEIIKMIEGIGRTNEDLTRYGDGFEDAIHKVLKDLITKLKEK